MRIDPETPIMLLLTLTVPTKVTLVAYDNNVSILLTLMVAATVMAELVTAVQSQRVHPHCLFFTHTIQHITIMKQCILVI